MCNNKRTDTDNMQVVQAEQVVEAVKALLRQDGLSWTVKYEEFLGGIFTYMIASADSATYVIARKHSGNVSVIFTSLTQSGVVQGSTTEAGSMPVDLYNAISSLAAKNIMYK